MKNILILFFIPTCIFSQTNVGGIINSNQLWTSTNSPYIVTSNLLILSGFELKIEPGVVIKFDTGNSLQVQGTLKAIGDSINKITFTSNNTLPNNGDWGYIEFMDQTIDASYDSTGKYIDGSCLINVDVNYGGGGNSLGILKITNSAIYLNNATISNSLSKGIYINKSSGGVVPKIKISNSIIKNNSDAGIFCDCYQYNVSIEVDSSIIHRNNGDGISTGGGDAGGSHNFIFSNNIITNNYIGIKAHANGSQNIINNIINNNLFYGIRLRGNGQYNINKNIITNNKDVGIHAIYADQVIDQNIIANNNGGIEISQSGSYIISNNLIYNNNNGRDGSVIDTYGGNSQSAWSPPISINGNTITKNISDTASILIFNPDNGTPNFSLNNNNIFNNESIYEIMNFRNINTNNINALNNYWGDTLASIIDAKIFDWFDNNYRSIVNYSPYQFKLNIQNPISPPKNVIKYILGDVEVSWDANNESDIKGYKVYYGNYNGYSFENSIDVGNITTYNLAGLVSQLDTIVAVTAYDSLADGINDQIEGHESWFSLANVIGCTDSLAINYNLLATIDDSSCIYNNNVTALFINDTVCQGDTTQFTDLSTSTTFPITSYNWIISGSGIFVNGTSSTSQNTSFIFDSCGIYSVTLIVNNSNGLSDSINKIIEVLCNPIIYISAPDTTCYNSVTCFSDSIIGDPTYVLNWDFGNNANFIPPSTQNSFDPCVLYYSLGSFYAYLYVTDIKGCKSTGSTYLTIDSCNTTGLENIIHKSKKLINITDISGRNIINFKKNTLLFYFFDDGTFEKVIRLE